MKEGDAWMRHPTRFTFILLYLYLTTTLGTGAGVQRAAERRVRVAERPRAATRERRHGSRVATRVPSRSRDGERARVSEIK